MEGESAPTCSTVARDADGDGHGDAACEAAPGDDCNDSPEGGALVHPGASEVCNGQVDDDCNGLADLDDEVMLPGTDLVVAEADGTTLRDHPTITMISGGDLGIAWSDARSGEREIYYRRLYSWGTLDEEVKLTDSADYSENDHPDLGVTGSGPRLVYRSERVSDGAALARIMTVSPSGGVTSPASTITSGLGSLGPQVSNGLIFLQLAGGELMACSSNACSDLDADGPYFADGFHVAWSSARVVYENDGDLYLRTEDSTKPGLIPEPSPEARSNPVVTHVQDETVVAYRTEDGAHIWNCPVADAIPIDAVATPSQPLVLAWDADQTKLLLLAVTSDCAFELRGVVAKEQGTTIGSAALALDYTGVIGVVWSLKDDVTNQWRIMARVIDMAACL
jgi:hypothetical protein